MFPPKFHTRHFGEWLSGRTRQMKFSLAMASWRVLMSNPVILIKDTQNPGLLTHEWYPYAVHCNAEIKPDSTYLSETVLNSIPSPLLPHSHPLFPSPLPPLKTNEVWYVCQEVISWYERYHLAGLFSSFVSMTFSGSPSFLIDCDSRVGVKRLQWVCLKRSSY